MDWNNIDLNPCTNCNAESWRLVHEDEPDRDERRDTSKAILVCNNCGSNSRVFTGNGPTRQTGALRE